MYGSENIRSERLLRDLPCVHVHIEESSLAAVRTPAGSYHDCFPETVAVLNPIEMDAQPRQLIVVQVPLLEKREQSLDQVVRGHCGGILLLVIDLKNHVGSPRIAPSRIG
jgi:hypothetical protein